MMFLNHFFKGCYTFSLKFFIIFEFAEMIPLHLLLFINLSITVQMRYDQKNKRMFHF